GSEQPFRAESMAATILSTVTSVPPTPSGHAVAGKVPSAMFTTVSSSSTVTPSLPPLQLPAQKPDGVDVALGVPGVAGAVGVPGAPVGMAVAVGVLVGMLRMLMRPMLWPSASVNQIFPSGPVVIPDGPLPAPS